MAFLLNLSISRVAAAEGDKPASGETRIERASGEDIRNLGVETTGILPSNPFYFFKEWGRGIRKALSFNTLSRAELQLDIANEQAAEIAKLQELDIKNPEAYSRAVISYDQSVVLAEARIEALKGTALSDRFALTVIDRALRHSDILDALYTRIAASDSASPVLGQLLVARTDIVKTAAAIADVLGNNDRVAAYVRAASGRMTKKWHELKAVEFINRWENIAPQSLRDGLITLKASLMLQLAGRLEGAGLEDFEATDKSVRDALEQLPGVPLERLRSLDSLRESAADSDIKNYANLVRSKLFDRLRGARGIGKDDAGAIVAEMNAMLTAVAGALGDPPKRLRIDAASALERAKFTASSAKEFLDDGVYDSAYGQASTAFAAAENIYAELLLGEGDIANDLKVLKREFDILQSRIAAIGTEKKNAPKLFAALSDAERAIVKVADLIAGNASGDRVAEGIRVAKRAMGAAAGFADESEKKK